MVEQDIQHKDDSAEAATVPEETRKFLERYAGEGPQPVQAEMPFALVYGKAVTKLPDDLYIPPDALEVFLEAFEGPLDLLLYLIKRQNLDILSIPVARITEQYMEYVELMKALNLELAAEYLVMAALLGEIKSRSLLPRNKDDEDDVEEDPRAELVRRLQEYERFKQAAEDLEKLPREGRDFFIAQARRPDYTRDKPQPDVDMQELMWALHDVFRRADMFESHHVEKEKLSTRERMSQVLEKLSGREFVPFVSLFSMEEGKLGVVVTFIALLELLKNSLIELVQNEPFAPIHVKAKTVSVEESELLAELVGSGASGEDETEGANDAFEQEAVDTEEDNQAELVEADLQAALDEENGPFH